MPDVPRGVSGTAVDDVEGEIVTGGDPAGRCALSVVAIAGATAREGHRAGGDGGNETMTVDGGFGGIGAREGAALR